MANILSSAVQLYIGGFDLGTSSTKMAVTLAADALDVTAFRDVAESNLGGVRTDSTEWAAWFDDGAASIDTVIGTVLGTLGEVLSFGIGTGVGARAYCGTVFAAKGGIAAEMRGLVRIEGELRPDKGLDSCKGFGSLLVRAAAEYAGATIDDGALSTGTAVFYGNCVSVSGIGASTGNFILRHSSDGTTFSNGPNWSGITGTQGTRIEFTTTLNRYISVSFSTADGTTGTYKAFIAYKRG